jgi:hypothetical protein
MAGPGGANVWGRRHGPCIWSRSRTRSSVWPCSSSFAEGRRLRFLANVDPVDVARALEGLNPGACLLLPQEGRDGLNLCLAWRGMRR